MAVTIRNSALRADALLILTSAIWGFAFVAQRVGMQYVGPFTFNAVRFALGGLSLAPLLILQRKQDDMYRKSLPPLGRKKVLAAGGMAGLLLFSGASLQQSGVVYTTAGNAGFITGLYVVIVPLMGLLWKQRPDAGTWIGAMLAAVGLYLLSVTDRFTISHGDLYVLVSAFFWAAHVHIIGLYSARVGAIRLAFMQFMVCSLLSLVVSVFFEEWSLAGLRGAFIPIFYGGCFSVGVAYTLQVVAQRDAKPAHASIILSLESVFAALGGWLLLGEVLSGRGLTGCAFMLGGMLLSQFGLKWRLSARSAEAPVP